MARKMSREQAAQTVLLFASKAAQLFGPRLDVEDQSGSVGGWDLRLVASSFRRLAEGKKTGPNAGGSLFAKSFLDAASTLESRANAEQRRMAREVEQDNDAEHRASCPGCFSCRSGRIK